MINLDKKNRKVETDCKTVGDFMTEAAELSGGNITIIVDGCRYELHDNPKIKVTDETPLGSVIFEPADSLLSGVTVLRVTTKPKPKTVKKSGWVAIYNDRGRWMTNRFVFESKESAIRNWNGIQDPIAARIEWEEEVAE